MSPVPTPDAAKAELAKQKARALEVILDAWDKALAEGIAPDHLASSAIFAALTDMVDIYGAQPVADMCAGLPKRILAGEFSFDEPK
jgi:hypothetical protein